MEALTDEETEVIEYVNMGQIDKISTLPIESQYKLLYYFRDDDNVFTRLYNYLDFNLGEQLYLDNRDNFELIRNLDVNQQKQLKNYIGFEVWISNTLDSSRGRRTRHEHDLKHMVDNNLGNDEDEINIPGGCRSQKKIKSKRRKSKRRKSKRRKSKRRK